MPTQKKPAPLTNAERQRNWRETRKLEEGRVEVRKWVHSDDKAAVERLIAKLNKGRGYE